MPNSSGNDAPPKTSRPFVFGLSNLFWIVVVIGILLGWYASDQKKQRKLEAAKGVMLKQNFQLSGLKTALFEKIRSSEAVGKPATTFPAIEKLADFIAKRDETGWTVEPLIGDFPGETRDFFEVDVQSRLFWFDSLGGNPDPYPNCVIYIFQIYGTVGEGDIPGFQIITSDGVIVELVYHPVTS